MPYTLPELPYALDALEPLISKETLTYHHQKHHQGYVNKLNGLLEDHPTWQDASLETLVQDADGAVFNNAAQVWNHTFYWNCLSPEQDQQPEGAFMAALNDAFGSFEAFQSSFLKAAANTFGSGWAWLVKTSDGALAIHTTSNADNPLRHGHTPLLTCDVWEHAYYIDTRNDRPEYLARYWRLINWSFVTQQWKQA